MTNGPFSSYRPQLKWENESGKYNAIKIGVRGFVRICIETCARGYCRNKKDA